MLAAVVSAPLTPRLSMGPVHFGISDALGALGVGCWVMAWMVARSRPAMVGRAIWPALAVVAGLISIPGSPDLARSAKGVVQLVGQWALPSLAIVGAFTSVRWRSRLLSAMSAGSLLAAAVNCAYVLRHGISGGLPQVWGAAGGFQGYFQVFGLTIALVRLASALPTREVGRVMGWSLAIAIHTAALLLTQTRGAWIAGLVAVTVLALRWRRTIPAVAGFSIVVTLGVALSPDWTALVRERIQGVVQPEPSRSGFDSSVIRAVLAATAWEMFADHPLTGIGLKNFAVALPMYAPPGLPLVVEMGGDAVPTLIEGPHSTYLSLLSETGLLGAAAVVGWVVAAWAAAYRWNRSLPADEIEGLQVSTILLGAIAAVAVFNLFAEMNASGALPLVALLALGCGIADGARDQSLRV